MPFFIPSHLQSGGFIRSNGIIVLIDISDKLVIGASSRPFGIGKFAVVGDEGLIITDSAVTRFARQYVANNAAIYETHPLASGHVFKRGNTVLLSVTDELASFIAAVRGVEIKAEKKVGNVTRSLRLAVESNGVALIADSPEENNVKLRLKSGSAVLLELSPLDNGVNFGGKILSNIGEGVSDNDAARLSDIALMVKYAALDTEGLPIVYVSPTAATENAAISRRTLRTVATPVKAPIMKITGNWTATVGDKYIVGEIVTSRTVTLPVAGSSVGTELVITRSGASSATATLTVLCSGTDKIYPGAVQNIVLSNDWQSVSLVAIENTRWLKTSEVAGTVPNPN